MSKYVVIRIETMDEPPTAEEMDNGPPAVIVTGDMALARLLAKGFGRWLDKKED